MDKITLAIVVGVAAAAAGFGFGIYVAKRIAIDRTKGAANSLIDDIGAAVGLGPEVTSTVKIIAGRVIEDAAVTQ